MVVRQSATFLVKVITCKSTQLSLSKEVVLTTCPALLIELLEAFSTRREFQSDVKVDRCMVLSVPSNRLYASPFLDLHWESKEHFRLLWSGEAIIAFLILATLLVRVVWASGEDTLNPTGTLNHAMRT